MKAQLLCPSQHLDAFDVATPTKVTIKNVGFEKVGISREVKGVICFQEFGKAMIVNRTKHDRLIEMFGDETDDWIDQQVILYPSETDYETENGTRRVPCLNVRSVDGRVVFAE